METTTQNTQELIEFLIRGQPTRSEIHDLLNHPSPVVRANALNALVPVAQNDDTLVEAVITAVEDPANTLRLMGTISIRHLAMACLYRIGSPHAVNAATRLLAEWSEPDRDDLVWYLHAEGLTL